jgi:hypothetical protein
MKKDSYQQKKKQIRAKIDVLTSFQVIDRKNDWKFIYVSNLAQNNFKWFSPNLLKNLKTETYDNNVLNFNVMETTIPNQISNRSGNILLFGKLQILFMKRLLLLLVLAFYCVGTNAQEVRATQGAQLMEVKAYLAYLKTSEVSARNSISNSNRLEHLLSEVQPAVYYLSGELKSYGANPTALYTNSGSLSSIQNSVVSKQTIEIVTINISQNADLSTPIDLSVFSNFPNLKYIYILSNVETTGTVISNLIRNNNANVGVFYKIDKGA